MCSFAFPVLILVNVLFSVLPSVLLLYLVIFKCVYSLMDDFYEFVVLPKHSFTIPLFFIMLCILREKDKFLLQLNLNHKFLELCFICFLHVSFSAIISIIKKNQNLFSSLRTKKIA